MRVLITGNRGFIGQNLVKYVQANTNWEVSTYDMGDPLPSVIDKDWVLHIGAISSTTERDIELVLKQNYDFTCRLYDECKTFGVGFQYSSSASLYGLGNEFTETSPLDPKTPYAWSKYLVERYIDQRPKGSVTHGFRYFNVYGNYEDHKGNQGSPVSQFSRQAQSGNIKLFHNSDEYLRDFIAVEDVCRIHVEFINRVTDSGVWNVGTGKTTSFQDIANLISKKYDSSIEYIDMPEILKSSYQKYTCADLTRLEATLGPQHMITVRDWLDKYKL